MKQHLNNDEFAQCCAFGPANGMAQHLTECDACCAELARLRASLAEFGQAVRASAERDEWFWQRQRARLRERVVLTTAPRLQWALAGVAAVAVLAVALLGSAIVPASHEKDAAGPRVPQSRAVANIATDDAADEALLRDIQKEVTREVPQALAAMGPLHDQMTGRRSATLRQGENND
jgi:hypothetical protein